MPWFTLKFQMSFSLIVRILRFSVSVSVSHRRSNVDIRWNQNLSMGSQLLVKAKSKVVDCPVLKHRIEYFHYLLDNRTLEFYFHFRVALS